MIPALAAAGLLATALLVPHLLRPASLTPSVGVGLWTAVMLLRASVACAIAAVAVLYLPATELFNLLTHWCLHAVLPFFAEHLGFDGHHLGDAAVLVPALVVGGLGISAALALLRAARGVAGLLRRDSIGGGPRRSTIVRFPEVLIAAAGVTRPRVIVSAGALVELDEQELAAGLEHEWGHVQHHHGLIAAVGHVCRGISRILPGGHRAFQSLRFHLERQADEYAIARTGDPLALASAITKAVPAPTETPALGLLGGGASGAERVRLLMDTRPQPGRATSRFGRGLAAIAAVLAILIVLSLPMLIASAPAAGGGWHSNHVCEDEHSSPLS